MTTTTTLIEVDSRRRVTLANLGRKGDTRYLVEEHEDGTLVFTPAAVMPQAFADLMANPELLAQVERGEAADRSSLIRRPSFGKHFRQ
jgi:hypothetical protein